MVLHCICLLENTCIIMDKYHVRSLHQINWKSTAQVKQNLITFMAAEFELNLASCTAQWRCKKIHYWMGMMNCISVCPVYHCPPVAMDHGKAGNRYSALFSPGRFCFLLYHAPSSGDFSSAISSSSSSNTSSAAGEGGRREGLSINLSCFSNTTNTYTCQLSHCFRDESNLLCRSTPSIRWALSRSAAASEASGTPASSPHALSLWQIPCWRNTEFFFFRTELACVHLQPQTGLCELRDHQVCETLHHENR